MGSTYFTSINISSSTNLVGIVSFLTISSRFLIEVFTETLSFSITSIFFISSLFGLSMDLLLFLNLLPGRLSRLGRLSGLELFLLTSGCLDLLLPPYLESSRIHLSLLESVLKYCGLVPDLLKPSFLILFLQVSYLLLSSNRFWLLSFLA